MFTKTFPRPFTCTKTSRMWLTIITIFSRPSSLTNTFIGLIKTEKANYSKLHYASDLDKNNNSLILLEHKIHTLNYTPHYIWGNHNLVQAILHHIYRSEVYYFDTSHIYNWAMFHKYHIILQTILIHTCNNNNRWN